MTNPFAAYLAKYEILLWYSITILSMVALTILVVYPQTREYFHTSTAIQDAQTRNQNLQKKIDSLKKIDIPLYRSNIEAALRAVPEEKDPVSVLGYLQKMTAARNLKVDSISFPQAAGSDKLSSYQILVSLTGRESSIKNFVDDVGSFFRLMKVDGLEVSKGKSDDAYQATLRLFAYYSVLPTALGDIEKPISLLTPDESQIISKIQSSYISQSQTQIVRTSTSSSQIQSSQAVTTIGRPDPFD